MIRITGQLGACLLIVGLLTALVHYWGVEARPEGMDDWTIEDLVMHLRTRGVEFRTVATYKNGSINTGAFLTTTDKPWDELNALTVCSERIERWQGTVFCGRVEGGPGNDPRLQLWGNNCLRRGPFIFFGDAALRARIDAALRQPASGPAPRDTTR
jgi:hypothetical protein